jgi:ADP-heptose:LPS heptosyltransferase
MNIGISWAGGSKLKKKQDRSMSLEKMLPILSKANQNANIINLQYGDHSQEIEAFEKKTGIIIHDWKDCDPIKDLENFSAQVKSLDLVISIDNSTVHFSGALGTKTYVLLPFDQDWRWAEGTNESYWYPGIVTVFKQREAGEWDKVIQKITNALE